MHYSLIAPGCLILLILVGCSSDSGYHDMTSAGIGFSFECGAPYDFTGAKAADQATVQIASDLLRHRQLIPQYLAMHTEPHHEDKTDIKDTLVISKSDIGVMVGQSGTEDILVMDALGDLDADGDQVVVVLDKDMQKHTLPIRILFTFNRDSAQDQVDGLKDLKDTNLPGWNRSPKTVQADVDLHGIENGEEWDLSCKVSLTCVAEPWLAL